MLTEKDKITIVFTTRRNGFTVKKRRPINLNLFTIQFPLPAIASILHRISGIILFLAIPLMLWVLHASLATQEGYDGIHEAFTTPCSKFIIWCLLSAFIYHFVAGIRHLLLDINVGVNLKSGKMSALITILIAAVLIVLTGIWLW
jgi:succinate dehydrogenase / fumarate reductase cytochrome b subunit